MQNSINRMKLRKYILPQHLRLMAPVARFYNLAFGCAQSAFSGAFTVGANAQFDRMASQGVWATLEMCALVLARTRILVAATAE